MLAPEPKSLPKERPPMGSPIPLLLRRPERVLSLDCQSKVLPVFCGVFHPDAVEVVFTELTLLMDSSESRFLTVPKSLFENAFPNICVGGAYCTGCCGEGCDTIVSSMYCGGRRESCSGALSGTVSVYSAGWRISSVLCNWHKR